MVKSTPCLLCGQSVTLEVWQQKPLEPRMMKTKKYRSFIAEEWQDDDGYWIALAPGLMNGADPHCHQIHEDTKAQAYSYLSEVVPCTCPEHRTMPCGCAAGNCRCVARR